MATRTFEINTATREQVPLIIGLMGPSGGGKTYSALRVATGIQRVSGGDICIVDTEARRALHYADKFKFLHLPFGAPFSPLDYLAAIEYAAKRAKTIIVDSMSHEHEGPGGVLEMHEAETQRLSGGDRSKAERVKMLAWGKPKSERRRLINTVLQIPANFIFCFRAKEKIKPDKKEQSGIRELGWQPIAGEEFVYEMATCALLMPGANGIPTWAPENPDEKKMVKLPEQFRPLFQRSSSLSEAHGEVMAQWASGGTVADAMSSLKGRNGSTTTAARQHVITEPNDDKEQPTSDSNGDA